MSVKPLHSPEPELTPVSHHPSYTTLKAVKTGNTVTTIWGAVAAIATALGVAWINHNSNDAKDDLAAKHAALQQEVVDLKIADREAHERIEKHIEHVAGHNDERFDELLQAVQKKH